MTSDTRKLMTGDVDVCCRGLGIFSHPWSDSFGRYGPFDKPRSDDTARIQYDGTEIEKLRKEIDALSGRYEKMEQVVRERLRDAREQTEALSECNVKLQKAVRNMRVARRRWVSGGGRSGFGEDDWASNTAGSRRAGKTAAQNWILVGTRVVYCALGSFVVWHCCLKAEKAKEKQENRVDFNLGRCIRVWDLCN
ncbi:uncharacterized protein BDZ99DRAFT_535076 [Mytilinidion resinicola]|uniref:Uncharacterized protein n=1 Tax=Mytilinidion resinicola TaxID=574789 RepID=A0A6A6YGD6_9PEZI|nr:uncharacterized protein BDZ99DRAFT_535076 [Mytilinidion resinicola]KAF2807638.1 hypothetical protein BDZ99DRAFT_535076 [Mytilinidion resinicola]